MVYVEAVVMPNDEVISFGKSLGFISKAQRDLIESGAYKQAKNGDIVIALRSKEDPDARA